MPEIITGMGDLPWLIAHPMDILFNIVNELLVLLDGIGVIKS